nr:hypothetical protein Itr_chr11CG21970 [Ipomoea trifida]GMD52822.1 hypothetical protein Iba_chr11bCG15290 [Ipomoea batatas]GMD54570.1 hypothetical protein Iba_chr11cCG13410 [Ipomoea batatas]GMD55863.1 hypothetical protein Iba_chr11dCG12040 [Ipomoea batatas]
MGQPRNFRHDSSFMLEKLNLDCKSSPVLKILAIRYASRSCIGTRLKDDIRTDVAYVSAGMIQKSPSSIEQSKHLHDLVVCVLPPKRKFLLTSDFLAEAVLTQGVKDDIWTDVGFVSARIDPDESKSSIG